MAVLLHHHVPGRTRLRIAPWPRPEALAAVHDMLAGLGGELAAASPVSAGLLVRHDPAMAAEEVRRRVEEQLAAPATPAESDARPAGAPPSGDGELNQAALTDAEGVLRGLGSGPEGLDSAEAARRLARHGANTVPAPAGRSRRDMAVEQFTTFPVALLLGSAVLSVATGGIVDAVVTIGVVLANASIGFSSENATENLIRRLSRPVAHDALVLRDGAAASLPAREVVPGDVILLSAGSFVPADARIIESHHLSADESGLTGESLPVRKQAEALVAPPSSVAARLNLLHGGTVITGGNGKAVVVRTGSGTEMARTRAMIGLARPPRPEIEDQLAALGRQLALGCVGASAVVFAIGLARGEPILAIVRSAIALAVAAIPEGLPAVATSTLALGARALEQERAYVRALPAIEALGTIDTICLDKTGTLTENRMRVVGADVDGRSLDLSRGREWLAADIERLRPLAEVVALCNEASLVDGSGSATELALLQFARLAGIDPQDLHARSPVLTLHSRNHRRRWMATEHWRGGGVFVAVKGAPDELLAIASHELSDGAVVPLEEPRRQRILAANADLAARGLRVLGVGRRGGDPGVPAAELVWLGLVGLADPVRAEARAAIETFHRAGIRTIMLTGDQPATALAVAETLALSRTGIIPVVETSRFAGLGEREVGELALKTSVFARVSPGDKLRIVKGLQAVGRRVAMIGDGINDGPALRAASVGVAMGAGGTDVAREVADVVIADDDLRALARAIARGRATNDNIRAATRYFLATNLSEVLVMLGETLHGAGEQETPMELFWLNLVTDILPGLGLALAEPRGDVMIRPPRAAAAPLFAGEEIGAMAREGGGIAVAALAAHFLQQMRTGPGPAARGATFLTLALAQFAHAWNLQDRSSRASAALAVSERRLGGALGMAGLLLAAPFITPPLRTLLGIAVPPAGSLVLSAALAGGYGLMSRPGRGITPGTAAAAAPSPASRPARTGLVPDLRPVRVRVG